MTRLSFSARINASPEKVWQALWDQVYYETWTSAFTENSTVQTDNWREGSRVMFVDGTGNGMISRVEAHRPGAFMSFMHLGMIVDGVEKMQDETEGGWAGAIENYTLTENEGACNLLVETDMLDEFVSHMESTWPRALEILKGLAEGHRKPVITIHARVEAGPDLAWECWTRPEHVMQWNHASDDWHCPAASNDLRAGGNFSYTMAARDGSFSFDFGGKFEEVREKEYIHATLGDGRMWKTWFRTENGFVKVTEKFEAEQINSLDLQQGGWQAILNNYKKYTENQ